LQNHNVKFGLNRSNQMNPNETFLNIHPFCIFDIITYISSMKTRNVCQTVPPLSSILPPTNGRLNIMCVWQTSLPSFRTVGLSILQTNYNGWTDGHMQILLQWMDRWTYANFT